MCFNYGSLLVLVGLLASDSASGNRYFQTDAYAGMNIVRPEMTINGDPWLYMTTYENEDSVENGQKLSEATNEATAYEWNKFNQNSHGNPYEQAQKKWIENGQNNIQSTKVHSYSSGSQESTKPAVGSDVSLTDEWQNSIHSTQTNNHETFSQTSSASQTRPMVNEWKEPTKVNVHSTYGQKGNAGNLVVSQQANSNDWGQMQSSNTQMHSSQSQNQMSYSENTSAYDEIPVAGEWQQGANGANSYSSQSEKNTVGTILEPVPSDWNSAQITKNQMQSSQVPGQQQVNLSENKASSTGQPVTNEWKEHTEVVQTSQNEYNRPKITSTYNEAQNIEWNQIQNSKFQEHSKQVEHQENLLNQASTSQGNINEWETNTNFQSNDKRPETTHLPQDEPALNEWQVSQTTKVQSQSSANQQKRPSKANFTAEGVFYSNDWPNVQNSNGQMHSFQTQKQKNISKIQSTPSASEWQAVHTSESHEHTAPSPTESQNGQSDNFWEELHTTNGGMQTHQEGQGPNFDSGEEIPNGWKKVTTTHSQSSQQQTIRPQFVSTSPGEPAINKWEQIESNEDSTEAQTQENLPETMYTSQSKPLNNEWLDETKSDVHPSKNHKNWTNSAPVSQFEQQNTSGLENTLNTNVQTQSSHAKEVENVYGTESTSYGNLTTSGWENTETTKVHTHPTNNMDNKPQHMHPVDWISISKEQSGSTKVNTHSSHGYSSGSDSQLAPNNGDWTNVQNTQVHVESAQGQENWQAEHLEPPSKSTSMEKPNGQHVSKEWSTTENFQHGHSTGEQTSQEVEDKLTNFSYKISLGFVFGVTETMASELEDMKRGIKDVLNAMNTRGDTIVGEYIWSPFGNAEVGPLTVTSDPHDFERIIKETEITKKGVRTNCQARVFDAIKNALEVALPGSFIYLITDAVPRDHNALQVVSHIIKQKAIKVFVLKSNGCRVMGKRKLWEYNYLAQSSSGQVFSTTKDNFLPVFQYINEDLRSNAVTLAVVNRMATPPGKFNKFNLVVDSSMKEFKVSLTGVFGSLRLIDPQRKEMNLAEANMLLNLTNIKVLKIFDPSPGKWELRVESASPYNLRVTGISKIGFNFGFVRILNSFKKPGIIQTHSRPLKDTESSIFIETTDANSTVRFVTVDVLDLKGRVLSTLKLKEDSASSGFFKASNFIPPTTFFNLQVNGFNEHGFAIQRISPTPISAEPPLKPVVVLDRKKFLGVGYMGRIKCHVESLIPVIVNWYKDGQLLDAQEKCSETCTVYLRIRKVSEEISGNYVCEAVNKIGMEKKEIRLIAGSSPKISVPNLIYTGIGSEVSFKCEVRSMLPFMFRWVRIVERPKPKFKMPAMSTPPLLEDVLLPLPRGVTDRNGILHIKSVTEDMLGLYACVAKSAAGHARADTRLMVSEALRIQVSKNSRTFTTGDCLRLTCIGYGAPPPDLKWVKNGREIVDPVVEYAKKDTTLVLMIPNAKREDAGTYSCVATNNYDLKVASAKVIFHPVNTPPDARKLLMC